MKNLKTQQKFQIKKQLWIKDLKEIIQQLEKTEYIENSPMLFLSFDVELWINEVKKSLEKFIRFKRVKPIREERIRKLNIIKEKWYKKLKSEGKELWENYKNRPWIPEENKHAHSWDD